MQAAEDDAEIGAAICPDLLTARWGEQANSTVVDRGPCDAFLPCLSWATNPPGESALVVLCRQVHQSEPDPSTRSLSRDHTAPSDSDPGISSLCVRRLGTIQHLQGKLCDLLSVCAGGRKRPYDHDKAMAREAAELQEQLVTIASAENTQDQPREPEEAMPDSAGPWRCPPRLTHSDMHSIALL